jgi:hypothetical protein
MQMARRVEIWHSHEVVRETNAGIWFFDTMIQGRSDVTPNGFTGSAISLVEST